MKPAGAFDHEYCRKIQDACLRAILKASVDPATNTAMLRNAELAKALLRISATLPAASKEASSPIQIRHLAEDYAKDFRRLVTANTAELNKTSELPFAVFAPG
jgi:hypothetical protein